MTKEEYMAMSLPYGLKLYFDEPKLRLNWKEHTENEHVANLTGDVYADIENKTFPIVFTPICRPLSDLTEEIVQADYNDGKPFIPLIEIGIIFSDIFEYRNPYFNIQSKYDDCNCASISIDNVIKGSCKGIIHFYKKRNLFTIEALRHIDNECYRYYIDNLTAIQQLLKWHFAIGLKEDEFIPVSKEFNPYK